MVRKFGWFVIIFILLGLIIGGFGCIKIIHEAPKPPEDASKTAPAATLPKPPTIQAFVETGMPPGMTPAQFIGARDEIERLFMSRFGISYYAPRPNLLEYYKPHDLTQLNKAVRDLTKLTTWQYQADYFDCSNMSSLVEFALENAGFETLIVVGADPTTQLAHAWSLVLIKTPKLELVPIEATVPEIPDKYKPSKFMWQGRVTYQTYNDYVTRGWVFENIYQAYKYYPTEFQWWNSCRIDMNWFERGITKPPPSPPPPLVAAPIPIEPAIGSVIDIGNQPITFSWTPVPGVSEYEFVLARDAAFTNLIVRGTVPTTRCKLTERYESGTYFWRVRASSPIGQWSSVANFTIVTPLPPKVVTYSHTLLDETLTVEPGRYVAYYFDIDTSKMLNIIVSGSFRASGGINNDIDAYVMSQQQLDSWRAGYRATGVYVSGRVTSASFNVPLVASGRYYVVFSNDFSIISRKAVSAKVVLTWQEYR